MTARCSGAAGDAWLHRSTFYDATAKKIDDAEIVARITAICQEFEMLRLSDTSKNCLAWGVPPDSLLSGASVEAVMAGQPGFCTIRCRSFPTDEAAIKLLYLAIRNAGVRWQRAIEWTEAMSQFAIVFAETDDTGQANTKNLTYRRR